MRAAACEREVRARVVGAVVRMEIATAVLVGVLLVVGDARVTAAGALAAIPLTGAIRRGDWGTMMRVVRRRKTAGD